jgi:hypothetical protein
LTSRGASLKVKGQVYKTCVQRVMVHGSKNCPAKTENMQWLERTERMMVRWMCGVKLQHRRSSVELNEHLGIDFDISSIRMEETGCQVAEASRWLVPSVQAGARRRGVNV